MLKAIKDLFGDQVRWALNSDFHNWTIHDLSRREAQIVVESLRDSEKASLMVWRTGWKTWRGLRDPECSELLHSRVINKEAPETPRADDSFDPEITAVRSSTNKPAFSLRKATRFEAEYPVTVVCIDKEFKTVSIDISEGGLKVRDAMPEWVAGYCTLLLDVEDGQVLEVLGSLAEDQKHYKTRFEIVPSDKQSEFIEWFRKRFQS